MRRRAIAHHILAANIILLSIISFTGCHSADPANQKSSDFEEAATVDQPEQTSAAWHPTPDSQIPTPTLIPATSTPNVSPSPSPIYGCRSSPCPRNLKYAVNGCRCGNEIYDESTTEASYCCSSGYSEDQCVESILEAGVRSFRFGSTADEIESHLVWIELQGWPILVHEKTIPAFEEVNAKLDGIDYRIREPIDSYSRRDVEGSDILSPHSYGIAIDINPSTNPSCGVTQACRCYNDLITDMPPEFVQAFKDAGFIWGGDWVEHPDPMHFEWVGTGE